VHCEAVISDSDVTADIPEVYDEAVHPDDDTGNGSDEIIHAYGDNEEHAGAVCDVAVLPASDTVVHNDDDGESGTQFSDYDDSLRDSDYLPSSNSDSDDDDDDDDDDNDDDGDDGVKIVSSAHRYVQKKTKLQVHPDQDVEPDISPDISIASSAETLQECTVTTEMPNTDDNNTLRVRGCDRPARPCPFCGKLKVRLTRHLKAVHKNEETVTDCLKHGSKQQRAGFRQMKRTGIFKRNLAVAGHKGAVLLCDRKPKYAGRTVVCDGCSGIFKRHWFSAHKKRCCQELSFQPKAVVTSVFFSEFKVSDDFKKDILSSFSNDEVGKLCRENEALVMIGWKLYLKVKARKDKKVEVKRSVMTDMRRLANLFCHFRKLSQDPQQVDVSDMFRRQNFDILEKACMEYTTNHNADSDNRDKCGLQLAVYYLLMKAAKILKVLYLIRNNDPKATETAEFIDVLNFSKDSLIGGALYNTSKNRQTKLRRVENLPRLADISKLRNHMCVRMNNMLTDKFLFWSNVEFVELRDIACARLTLFNARRGGEPARLQISHWIDGSNKVWFDHNRISTLSAEEQQLFANSVVMYQTGKGVNHLVPVLVPQDTVPALTKLADAAIRIQCGVNAANNYLFPSTGASEDGHVSGWHALNRLCTAAGVQNSNITATKMRHFASTMYASLDIPESKRTAFYKHMGHSKAVNEAIYQAPLAEQEVLQVGTVLQQFGKEL